MISNLEELNKSGRIILSCVSGSHAYGTQTPNSDVDMRGIFIYPDDIYLHALNDPEPQIGDNKHDITYYSLRRIFELLRKANPNMIELLWTPEDCIKKRHIIADYLIAHRDIFISKDCFETHSGYAFAQIKKAKGQNKKVHNPQPEEMPVKEDFCWVIPWEDGEDHGYDFEPDGRDAYDSAPCRPIPIKHWIYKLEHYHCARLEQTSNIYRLYHYGGEAKGVFRGDDMLVPESIPLKDEKNGRFYGLLIYSKDMYEKALKEWHSYWDWKRNRNEARWIDQEKGLLNYDAKNMMHCVRLLMSGENILVNGEPMVRMEGDALKYLMKIRNSEMNYEDIMADVEARMERLKELRQKSDIRDEADTEQVEKLYTELRQMAARLL